jgi:hypothetical protein
MIPGGVSGSILVNMQGVVAPRVLGAIPRSLDDPEMKDPVGVSSSPVLN